MNDLSVPLTKARHSSIAASPQSSDQSFSLSHGELLAQAFPQVLFLQTALLTSELRQKWSNGQQMATVC